MPCRGSIRFVQSGVAGFITAAVCLYFGAGFRFFPGGQAMALPATQNPLGRGAGQAKAKPWGRGAGRQAAGGLRN